MFSSVLLVNPEVIAYQSLCDSNDKGIFYVHDYQVYELGVKS
jgi:hypothetical protein